MAAAVFPGMWSLFRYVALGHQLVAHDGQHMLERRQLLGREPLVDKPTRRYAVFCRQTKDLMVKCSQKCGVPQAVLLHGKIRFGGF